MNPGTPAPPTQAGASGVPDPVEDQLNAIHRAFQRWDASASRRASALRRRGVYTAIAAPLAVVPLAIQIAAFHESESLIRAIAVALIVVELTVLFVLLLIDFADLRPSQDAWMRERVRAEALRRERFLVLARVGPYLTAPDVPGTIAARIDHIGDEITEPDSLILLEDRDGRAWVDDLEEATPAERSPADPRCLAEFQQVRVTAQERWYTQKSRANEHDFKRLETIVRGALVAGLVLSAIHLAILWYADEAHDPTRLFVIVAIDVLALILPAAAGAALALQTFLESRRLSRNYHSHALRLQRLGAQFNRLRAEPAALDADLRLKRLVLRTEGLLAEELLQWWLHTYR